MIKKILCAALLLGCFLQPQAQTPQPVKQLLNAPYMKGATFSIVVKDLQDGKTVYNYDGDREVSPASVLKTVATATALEILGDDYRFPTSLEYDGSIKEGVLNGNLYIKGSGDRRWVRLISLRTGMRIRLRKTNSYRNGLPL